MSRNRLGSILLILCCAIANAAEPANGKLTTPIDLNVPSQALSVSLRQLADQAGIQILFEEKIVIGLRAPALHSKQSVAHALEVLLSNTGLEYTSQDGTVAVRKKSQDNTTSVTNGGGQAAATSGGPAATSTGSIEEIVVTAQKREEKLRDVPASISVLSGERVENLSLNSLADFATYVPGFSVDSGGTPGNARLTLRGIQTGGGGAPLVGMYIDDAPVGSSRSPSSYILDLLPYDVQRIEVLRGPQGTLYGAGAMGGLVKYVLREADPNNLEARVGGTVETVANSGRPTWGSRATVNAPLIDGVLAVRFSGYYNDDAGYIDNAGIGVEGENTVTRDGGRLALFYQPAEDLKITASALFQNIESGGRALVELDASTLEPVLGRYTHSTAIPERAKQALQFYSLTVNWNLGFGALTSASSFVRTDNTSEFDYTPVYGRFCPILSAGAVGPCLTGLPDSNELGKITQEIRLSSSLQQKLSWMLGLFYTDEYGVNRQLLSALDASGAPIPSLNPLLNYRSPNVYEEGAVFGNLTYAFNDRFDVMAGGRWAKNSQVLNSTLVGPLVGPDQIIREASEADVFTWMISPRIHVNDASMVYGRVATGYRPGGPNSPLPGVPPLFNSDTTTNYEAGYKATLLHGALDLDLAVYYIDWKDIQISAVNPNGINYRANGGAASSRGVEFTTSYQLTDHWRFGATGSYTNAILEEDVTSLGGRAGDRLPQSPHWTESLTTDYETQLSSDWQLQLGGGYRHFGSTWSAVQSSPTAMEVPAQDIVDLYGGLILNRRTSIRPYIRNVFNNRSYLNLNDANNRRFPNFVPVQPRTIGINVDTKF
ncbi:MAG TPA: TonB-dependent receptor [Steroidobacteraceae bacterium]|jgi:outer membrane receptor protein involved in Fe transport